MKITRYSVTRPVTVIVLYALALGIAVTLLPKIAVDLYPSVAQPVLSVWTNLSGAGPADVEQNVTRPLEKALAASKNLVEMTSNSGFESSNIRLTFAYGTNMEEAVADAQALVNRLINALPDGTSSPVVRRFDISAAPVMRLVVRGNYPPDELRIFAEDEIQAEIERLDGVASADVTGGTTQIVRVAVSLNRLAALGLTLSDVTNALRGQNVLQSGGSLLRGTREYQLLTQQELRTIGQIKRLVVKTTQIPAAASSPARAQLTRLEDIADVAVAYNDNAARVSINGQNGVYIQVQAESDSNQVQVSKRVRAALDGINRNLPRGITLSVLQDNTTMINATLNQVYSNALQGAVLCMLIIFIFLRNIKSTLIIGISIPVSILLTLMCMAIFGFTLNLLTMTGLIMALGMTVDASIVILDNIHSYRLRGSKPAIAAILGSNEMFRPIVASTATTLCVFLPLVIYKNDLEMMGQLFSDLIFTVIISLVVSLVVALTAVPALAGPILKIETRRQKPLKNHLLAAIDRRMDAAFAALENAYSRALDFCLAHRALVLTLVLAVFAFSVLQADSIGMNMYFRTRTDDSVTLNVTLPQGTPIERTEKFLFTVEEIVKENVNGYINIILTARRNGQGSLQITLPAPAEQIDTPQTIQAKLTPLLSSFAGARVAFRAGRFMSSSSAVEISFSSRNVDSVMKTAEEARALIERYLPEVENPVVNIDEGASQMQVTIDRDRAAALGINLAAIANEIKTAIDGTNATTISRGDRLLNVQVRLRDQDRAGKPNLDAIAVNGRDGKRVALSNVASIVEGRAPSSIRHENQERVVRVSGDLPQGVAATTYQTRLKQTIEDRLLVPEDVKIRYLGEAAEVEQFNSKIAFIILTAVFLVFGLMASQFESFVDPAIIFFSIPLLFIGVIWIYKIGGQTMSMFSAVGIVALVGVIVNNGIVLVDYTNTLRARGLELREACLEAGRSRLRPILMTTLSTVIAMIPIAFFPGAGADSIQPIGKTFVGGLTVSSLFTLFVTPVMYSLLHHKRSIRR